MLEIFIPDGEYWDTDREIFINTRATTLKLEHSLISLKRWESKWCKPFLSDKEKTPEEIIDYVKCMTINKDVDPHVYLGLTNSMLDEIGEYIRSPRTATWFSDSSSSSPSREVITAEIIYYWMITLNIPESFSKWHLNELLTLIRVCEEKNKPQKKMSKKEILSRNAELNRARREAMHSKG